MTKNDEYNINCAIGLEIFKFYALKKIISLKIDSGITIPECNAKINEIDLRFEKIWRSYNFQGERVTEYQSKLVNNLRKVRNLYVRLRKELSTTKSNLKMI